MAALENGQALRKDHNTEGDKPQYEYIYIRKRSETDRPRFERKGVGAEAGIAEAIVGAIVLNPDGWGICSIEETKED